LLIFLEELLREEYVKNNPEWEKDLKLALKYKKKAEIQALSSHGFEFLTEEYLPEKLTTGDWI
jgi:DNA topoisomerase VI subunit A